MSAPAVAPTGRQKQTSPRAGTPAFGGLPQVNLLPDEVRAVQRLREVRGWFGLAVLLAIVLVVAGWLGSMLVVSSAQDGLSDEQARTNSLLADKAQYAAVTPVKADLDRAATAIVLSSGAEVEWADYIGAVTAVLPADVTLQTFATQVVDSQTGTALTSDPLVTPGVAAITFTGQATGAPDVASLIDSLNSITGFSDARVSVVQRNDQQAYDVTASVQVTPAAFSLRFMGKVQ